MDGKLALSQRAGLVLLEQTMNLFGIFHPASVAEIFTARVDGFVKRLLKTRSRARITPR
jgi:hypothetical protein